MTYLSSSFRLIAVAQKPLVRSLAARSLSSEPAQRLKEALAHYQKENFSRETPRRFKKEVLQPYLKADDESIEVEELNRLLTNIGHSEDCLSHAEQDILLQEAGCSGTSIPVMKLNELIG